MVLTCCVKECKSESYKGSGVSFHRFPKDEEIKNKWLTVIPGSVTKYSAVCSLHFKADDFATHPAASRKILKVNAIPSVFPVIVPDTKKVHILSSIKICQEIPQCPGMSSELPSKKMKLHQSITSKYFNLRLKTYAKSETLKLIGHKATMRQMLRKTILFSNV